MTTTSTGPQLPPQILEAIEMANARSIGGQPEVLAHLALGNQIFSESLAQLQALSAQQARSMLTLAVIGKAVELLTRVDPAEPQAAEQIVSMVKLVESQLLPVTPTRTATPEPVRAAPTAPAPEPARGSGDVTGRPAKQALPEAITEGIALGELLTHGQQASQLANLALGSLIQNLNLAQQNAVAVQQALNTLHIAVLGKIVHLLTTLGPVEAMAAQRILSGSAAAEAITDLRAGAPRE